MNFSDLRAPFWELQKELDQFFQPQYIRKTSRFPLINMIGKKDTVTVYAEVPGVSPEEVEVTIDGKNLLIKGNRKFPQTSTEKEKVETILQERKFGSFERKIRLPFRVDEKQVTAKYEQGVLAVTLKQAPEDKPKQIKINIVK